MVKIREGIARADSLAISQETTYIPNESHVKETDQLNRTQKAKIALQRTYQLAGLLAKRDFYTKPVELADGSTYGMIKIRTMHHNADSRLEEVVAKNGFNHQGRPYKDPRVIPDKAWIRETGVDEIPQIPQYTWDLVKHLVFRTERKWQASGTRGHSLKDKEQAIKENKFGRDTEGFFKKISKQGIALFPAHLCVNKPIDTPRKHAAVHRWHARYIEKGGSNFPLVMQFFWNYAVKGQRSS
jgi:hypothetical protein